MRSAVVAILVLALVPSAAAVVADDCATGGDAGDSFQTATPLALPVAACEGELAAGESFDYFRFDATAGQTIRATLRLTAGEAHVCVQAPSDPPGWTACSNAIGDDALSFALHETGAWRLVVLQGFAPQSSYQLTASISHQVVAGKILAGHFPLPGLRSLAAIAGPAADGVDGKWVTLDVVATGVQTASLRVTNGALADLDVRFFDASGAPSASQPCAVATSGIPETCIVPAGAAKALIEAKSGQRVPYELVYSY